MPKDQNVFEAHLAQAYERGFQDGMERAAKAIEGSLLPKNTTEIIAAFIREEAEK